MKGQHRLISELLLLLIGILITAYVITNFNSLQESVKGITTKDQAESVADLVSSAIVKVANMDNATIRLTVPDKISNNVYRISLRDSGNTVFGIPTNGGVINITTLDGSVSVERQLFNIAYDNTISSNIVINNSEVVSSAQFIEIVKNEKITLYRVSLRGT